jgi:hypothetical protein
VDKGTTPETKATVFPIPVQLPTWGNQRLFTEILGNNIFSTYGFQKTGILYFLFQ